MKGSVGKGRRNVGKNGREGKLEVKGSVGKGRRNVGKNGREVGSEEKNGPNVVVPFVRCWLGQLVPSRIAGVTADQ